MKKILVVSILFAVGCTRNTPNVELNKFIFGKEQAEDSLVKLERAYPNLAEMAQRFTNEETIAHDLAINQKEQELQKKSIKQIQQSIDSLRKSIRL